jgi:ATP-dependent DNA helicase RecQ
LVSLGHLEPDSEAYGALKLTASARGVLKGENKAMLREVTAASSTRKRVVKAKTAKRGATSSPDSSFIPDSNGKSGNANLLSVLRAWRTSMARERGVPAYVIFHDTTLEGIASSRPKTHDQLRTVAGIGDKKLERYGDALLLLVRSEVD